MSDSDNPAFDKSGKYLFFTASTDIGPAVGSGMSILNRAVTRSVYLVVLNKEDQSPLAPESDDEKDKADADKDKAKDEKAKDKKDEGKDGPKVKIDIENIDQRTLALPLPARNYMGLVAGKAGVFFIVEGPSIFGGDDGPGGGPRTIVERFDLS